MTVDLAGLLSSAEALIFDCDGTLAHTPPVYAGAWAAGMRAAGHDMPADWYMARSGMSEGALMDAFERWAGVVLPREDVVRIMRDAFVENVSLLQEIAIIAEIAREHKGKLPQAVASGGSRQIVQLTLDELGLTPRFDIIVTIDDVEHPKPAPDLFLEAARRLNVPPQACLVFEDSEQGFEAARRAGMTVVDVTALL